MSGVDLDAPEHAVCSEALARDKARISELEGHRRQWRSRAARAETELAELRRRILSIDTGKVIAASQIEELQADLVKP